MNPELAAKAMAAGRVAFGIAFMAAPAPLGERWVGKAAKKKGAQLFLRGLGGRDLALGLGVLLAPRSNLRTWVAMSAIADLSDTAATFAARDDLDSAQLTSSLAVAGGSTVVGLALAAALGGGDTV